MNCVKGICQRQKGKRHDPCSQGEDESHELAHWREMNATAELQMHHNHNGESDPEGIWEGERMQKGPSGTRLLPGARCCGDNSIVVTYLSPTPVPGGGKEAGVVCARWLHPTPGLLMSTVLPKAWSALCAIGANTAVTFWTEHKCFTVKWLQLTFYLFSTQFIDTLNPNTYQMSVTASFLLPQWLHCLKDFIFILPQFFHF